MNKTRLIIDTDPATGVPFKDVDDGLAILLLLAWPEASVEGLTINFGNVGEPIGCRVAREVLDVAGKDVPVFRGAGNREALGKLNPSVEFLIETVRGNPGEITLLALAPLTNVATAMLLDESFAGNLKDLVVMGGSLRFGVFAYFGEFNFHLGGKAADIVLSAPVPKTLITMDLCSQAVFRREHLDLLRDNSASSVSRYLAAKIEPWLRLNRKICFRKKGFFPWDVVAAAHCVDPTLFDRKAVSLRVRTGGLRTGSIHNVREYESFTPREGIVPMNMPVKLDAGRFMNLFIERLLSL